VAAEFRSVVEDEELSTVEGVLESDSAARDQTDLEVQCLLTGSPCFSTGDFAAFVDFCSDFRGGEVCRSFESVSFRGFDGCDLVWRLGGLALDDFEVFADFR
jgi:hypothetical protein